MGMRYSAVVIVGLSIEDVDNYEKANDLVDEGVLEAITPYYDGWDSRVVGFVYAITPSYSPEEFVWNKLDIEQMKLDFERLLDQEPKVLLMPYGR